MNKPKLFKNPQRIKTATFKPYVPQYQVHGVKPAEVAAVSADTNKVLINKAMPVSSNNPRIRPPPSITHSSHIDPYIEIANNAPAFVPLPNIGNNVDTIWTGLDGEIDCNDIDPNAQMIDNNFDDSNNYAEIPNSLPPLPTDKEIDLSNQEYVLVFEGRILSTGNKAEIEDEVRALVFGEHPSVDGVVLAEEIILLKRVKIKVGVFVE